MTAPSAAQIWDHALLAASLFAIDPHGVGGVVLRAGPGPVRDTWLAALHDLMHGAPVRRMPAGIGDDRLLGGIDLAATLKLGRPVFQNGILIEADGGIVIVPMAERLSSSAAARIAAVLDSREVVIERDGLARRIPVAVGVVALDEGASAEERLPAALAERCAFHIDLEPVPIRAATGAGAGVQVSAARARLAAMAPAPDGILEALAATAQRFGITSITAPLLALRAARAAAALAGRTRVTDDDALLAARLVLAPRARSLPQDETPADPPPALPEETPPAKEQDPSQASPMPEQMLEDVMRAAVHAALPPGLLESLGRGVARVERNPRNGTGAAQSSLLRGRPAGVRMGALRSGARLALLETLHAAAPWQKLRRSGMPKTRKCIEVRREDFRLKRFTQRREATVVFCVDASGSAAFHRLAEAKGAVELLLAEAYVARTYAALIAFRGRAAETLLPPSRSLTRAKSLLSVLPGGGGTPLAAGIDAAVLVALGERAKGRTPLLIFLTDGQANVARDGVAARPRAFEDAVAGARQIAAQGLAAVFVDTSPRARDEGARLAGAMAARYIALPHAQAGAMRDVIRAAVP